jgi:hypothetical protein
MTDVALLRRRHRPSDGYYGCECWLIGVYPPGSAVPILTVTNRPTHLGGDIVYGGYTYTSYNCSVTDPPESDSEHTTPEATVRISNILRALIPSLYANDFYRGYTVKILLFNDAEPGSDYTGDEAELTWVTYEADGNDLKIRLTVPQVPFDPVPEDTCSAYACRHRFRQSAGLYGARCGYTAPAIEDIVIPGGPAYGRLAVQITGHLYVTGDVVELSGIGGITPSLNDIFTVEKFNADWIKLDGTDGADYSGTWDSSGVAGHHFCPHHRVACAARGRSNSFGGLTGQRADVLRVAL